MTAARRFLSPTASPCFASSALSISSRRMATATWPVIARISSTSSAVNPARVVVPNASVPMTRPSIRSGWQQ